MSRFVPGPGTRAILRAGLLLAGLAAAGFAVREMAAALPPTLDPPEALSAQDGGICWQAVKVSGFIAAAEWQAA